MAEGMRPNWPRPILPGQTLPPAAPPAAASAAGSGAATNGRAPVRDEYRDPEYDPGYDGRREIVLPLELHEITRQAIEALAGSPELGLYVRSGDLVKIARDGSDPSTWLRRAPGAPMIRRVSQPLLLNLITQAARFTRRKENGEARRVDPPRWVAEQVMAQLEWPFPYLTGVTETPTIRRDGSILSLPGYDDATGLLYEPPPGTHEWPQVPERPTRADVEAAVQRLLEPVRDFPFVAATDRAAYVAAVLSLLARVCIDGSVPLFAVRAPAPGTGKGLLCSVIGLIGTGRTPAAMTFTADGDEMRKRIVSIALDGTPLVLLDNVSGALGSDELAAFLTATEVQDRMLGRSELVRVPLRAVWLATGNNLGFRKTMARRVVPIDLDAHREAPEDRTGFAYPDLLGHVRRERPRLVAASLTILRAFAVAGRPTHRGGAPMGSYEAWDAQVRSALLWAGLGDPAGTDDPSAGRARVRADADTDTEELGTLLAALAAAFPNGQWFTAADAIRRGDPALRDALQLAAPGPGGREATGASLGYVLRQNVNRPMHGLRLVRSTRLLHGSRPFAVEAEEPEAPPF